MPGEIFPTRSLDELAQRLRQRDAKPGLAPRSAPRTPDLAGVSNTLAEMSGMLSDARNGQLGISPPTSAPSRRIAAARPPVRILLYLVFIGLVATVIIVVFFGAGFFLLARKAAPVLGETEMPGWAAVVALPVSPPAERPAMGKAAPPQESNAARGSAPVSANSGASATVPEGATPSGEVPALRLTAGEARSIAPAQTASAPEPAATSSALPVPASPRLSAAEIPQLLGGAMHRPTRGRPVDHIGAISRNPYPRSDTTLDAARAGAGRARSANQNRKVDPEEGAARRENQREYEQLLGTERAAGPLAPELGSMSAKRKRVSGPDSEAGGTARAQPAPGECCDASWNPTAGCSVCSPGCEHCYAMRVAARLARTGGKTSARYAGLTRMGRAGPVWTGEIRVRGDLLTWPLFRRHPRRIAREVDFLSSAILPIADSRRRSAHRSYPGVDAAGVFLGRAETAARARATGAPRHWIAGFSRVKYGTPSSATMEIRSAGLDPWPLPNLWPGVSVEDHDRIARVRDLLETPAAIRWVCFEPLLDQVRPEAVPFAEGYFDALAGSHYVINGRGRAVSVDGPAWWPLDWVVAGGEIGAGARPMHPDWVRKLRDQCAAAGIPFFFKRWGEWALAPEERPGQPMIHVGNRAAGRLRDGRTWTRCRQRHERDDNLGQILPSSKLNSRTLVAWPVPSQVVQ